MPMNSKNTCDLVTDLLYKESILVSTAKKIKYLRKGSTLRSLSDKKRKMR